MRLPRAMLLAAFCAIAVLPATAAAQDSDPEAGSPPGAVYKLPTESGREDAAPSGGNTGSRRGGSRGSGRRGGSRGSQGGSGAPGSTGDSRGTGGARQFGGSPASQDAAAGDSVRSSRAGGDAEPGGPGGDSSSGGDSPLRSENNFGSSSRVPGLDDQATPPPANVDRTATTGGLGTGGVVGLVALAIIAALGLGLGLRRLSARS